ncbi:MAG TPA: hypothetical protein VGK85_09335 [Myxococcaceae bacterium]|jgi:hypothetical protein
MRDSSPELVWSQLLAAVLLLLLGVGALATAVAAAHYPGGTWMDRTSVGHSFWGNFLCDIARDRALDGRPHPAAAWGRVAEWVLVLALGLFFWIAPALVVPRRRRATIRFLGAVGTLGLLLVPVTSGVPHALALIAGAGPGFTATVLVLRGLRHRPGLAGLGALALALSGIELALFLGFHEGFSTKPLPPSVPAVQRLALLAAVAWMGACAIAVLRGQVDEAAPGSSTGSPLAT